MTDRRACAVAECLRAYCDGGRQLFRPVFVAAWALLAVAAVPGGVARAGGFFDIFQPFPALPPETPVPRVPEDDGKLKVSRPKKGLADPSAPAAPSRAGVVVGTGRLYGTPKSSGAGSGAAGTYTLNLVDATIQEGAAAVLGDIFRLNYTVDPKLDGKITIQTTTPVDKEGAAELFESSLRSIGGAVVRSGNIVRVVPADQATMGAKVGLAAGARGNSGSNGIGNSVKILPLRYVAAAEMKRLLEPIASYGGVVRVDTSRNALLLSGTDQEIASIREAVSVFDVDIMKGMSFALVPVRGLDADAVAENLTRIFASNAEGAMSGMVQFIPNKRLRSVLVISKQPEYLQQAKAWIQRLDSTAAGATKQFYTYSVRNRQAKDLVEVLNAMFSRETGGGEIRSSRLSRNEAPSQAPVNVADAGGQGGFSVVGGAAGGGVFAAQGQAGAPGGGASGSPSSFNADRVSDFPGQPRGDDLGGVRSANIGPGGIDGEPAIKVVADSSQNALLIMASESDYRRVEQVLATLDLIPNQVLIEATIAEVTLNDDLRFGVRWFFQNKSGNKSGSFSDLISGAVGSAFPGFSFVAKAAGGQVTLNALNQVGRVNVLASPSLMVLDKKTATLQIGDQVPITTQSAQSVLTPGAPIVNSVAYKDTGVILAITPRINESGRVLLDIEQEVSTVSRTSTSNIDSPTFGRRKVRTTVVVNDGEAITLGGLIQDRATVTDSQVPVLGDIPIIGNAFKDKQNTIEKTELVIMLTPRVVRDLNEAAAVTDEYRRRVQSFAPSRDPVRKMLRNVKRTIE